MEQNAEIDVENDEPSGKDTPSEVLPSNETITSPEKDKPKFVRLPLSRIKNIMKMDPDCLLISQDALFLITKSTEMFLEHLSQEAAKFMTMGKRKTLQRKDFDAAVDNIPSLCFLDGALE